MTVLEGPCVDGPDAVEVAEAPSPGSGRARRPGSRTTWAARACLGLTVVVAIAWLRAPTFSALFVLGRPVHVEAVAVSLFAVAGVLYGVAALRGESAWVWADTPARRAGLVAVRVATVMVTVVAVYCVGFVVLLSGGQTFVTVGGPGEDCWLVVRESALFTTRWDVFEVDGGVGLEAPVAETGRC